jgi:hypothetical protein
METIRLLFFEIIHMYYLPYQIKAFGLVWADNQELISAPLILEMAFALLLFFLSVFHLSSS